ncbi:hypothetical protein M8818_003549 [Zalaria obscura]|uniref:Uncharacterized protein n=1 Tax=Zalaria obscura TaxID=2024903 RepID=A0ACC3SF07_9PEZI
MPSAFEARKATILKDLAVPDSEYTDLSPKGSVDAGIRDLCNEINVQDGMVTTSSCAGRIAVYLEGKKSSNISTNADSPEDEGEGERQPNAGPGGKGGGRWLFVSHDPLDYPLQGAETWMSRFGLTPKQGSAEERYVQEMPLVHCKFEPMILHVLASSLATAKRILIAAQAAGFRESGISSISLSPDGSELVMVAIRTNGLSYDAVVGFEDRDGMLRPMVDEKYLEAMVLVANQRFQVNTERTERFRQALIYPSESGKAAKKEGWEDADVRRERLRAEGLKRRAEKLAGGKPGASQANGHVDTGDEMEGIGLFGQAD